MSKTRKIFWPAAQSSQLLEFVAREKNFSGIYINLLRFLGARPLCHSRSVRGRRAPRDSGSRRRRQHTDATTITLAQSHPSNALQSQMDKPNTVTTQYMLLFSQRKVALPSVVLSQ